MKEKIWSIDIEVLADGTINLEQDCGGGTQCVSLHPTHVRFLFEKAGYLKPVPHDDLTKRLAQQMFSIHDDLSTARCYEDDFLMITLVKLTVFLNEVLVPAGLLPDELAGDGDADQPAGAMPANGQGCLL